MGETGIAVVAGASGFVGSAVVQRFAAERWQVIGLSRRPPARPAAGSRHLALDLLDPQACARAASSLEGATHLVYAAVNETPGDLVASWTDPLHASRNGRMFDNLLDAMTRQVPELRHVCLVHGTKAYATHRPDWPAPVPLRESLPRPDNDDFYFRQEDRLWSHAASGRLHWTVLRAPMIAGGGQDSNLNALLAIAIFATLRREAGLALPFPNAGNNLGVMEMVDVALLAKAAFWAAGARAARNQIFNVANGDVYVWPDLWPVIAEEIGVPTETSRSMSVRQEIERNAGLWAELVRRHGLAVPQDPSALLGESGSLADFALGNCARSVLTSTIKIRQAGFHDCVDTAESVRQWIRHWRSERLLPPR